MENGSIILKIKSSRWEVFCKKEVLKIFTKFTGKHLIIVGFLLIILNK